MQFFLQNKRIPLYMSHLPYLVLGLGAWSLFSWLFVSRLADAHVEVNLLGVSITLGLFAYFLKKQYQTQRDLLAQIEVNQSKACNVWADGRLVGSLSQADLAAKQLWVLRNPFVHLRQMSNLLGIPLKWVSQLLITVPTVCFWMLFILFVSEPKILLSGFTVESYLNGFVSLVLYTVIPLALIYPIVRTAISGYAWTGYYNCEGDAFADELKAHFGVQEAKQISYSTDTLPTSSDRAAAPATV